MATYSLLRHLFYSSLKQIVKNRQSGRFRLANGLELMIMIYLGLRGAIIYYVHLTRFQDEFWHYEYLLCFTRTNPHLYDFLLVISLSMVIIFYYILKLGFELSPVEIWQYFHLLVVENMDIYYDCWKTEDRIVKLKQAKRQLILQRIRNSTLWSWAPERAIQGYVRLKADILMWKSMSHVNLDRMQRRQLIILKTEAEMPLRIRLVHVVTLIDMLCCAIQIGCYIMSFGFCITYGPAFIQASSWYHSPVIVIDLIGLFFAFPQLIRYSCIYCLCSFVANLVLSFKLKRSYARMRLALQLRHNFCITRSLTVLQSGNFRQIYMEHTRICAHILNGNRKFYSKMLFLFLFTNVPLNLYFITHLLFDHLPMFENVFFAIILGLQMFAAIFLLLRLAKNHKLIHRMHLYVSAIQQLLSTGNGTSSLLFLLCKLKFDQLLHRLTTSRYGMTVGPVFLITYESILKAFLVYIYFLLFTLLFRQARSIL